MMTFLAKPIGKILAAAVVIILILGFLQVRSCQQSRQQAAQSRVDRGQAGASIDAGAEAMNTVAGVAEADARIDAEVKGAVDEILSQPAGNSNVAALRAACRMRTFCADSRCAGMREADPAVAACRNAVGATP